MKTGSLDKRTDRRVIKAIKVFAALAEVYGLKVFGRRKHFLGIEWKTGPAGGGEWINHIFAQYRKLDLEVEAWAGTRDGGEFVIGFAVKDRYL